MLENAHAAIDRLLERLADEPSDLQAYQELRVAALHRKAAGGKPMRMRRMPRDPLCRVLIAGRLWAFDPCNSDRLLDVLRAVAAYATAHPEKDLEPVLRWLKQLLRKAAAD